MNDLDRGEMRKADAPSAKAQEKDPVCGMGVVAATARYQTLHYGKQYFFCCAGCLQKFQANPEKILSSPPKPMGSGLVLLGAPMVRPTLGNEKTAAPQARRPEGRSAKDKRDFV